MTTITRWLARHLHGLARRIEQWAGPKPAPQKPNKVNLAPHDPELVALAERYPGAPEHWLREVAAHLGVAGGDVEMPPLDPESLGSEPLEYEGEPVHAGSPRTPAPLHLMGTAPRREADVMAPIRQSRSARPTHNFPKGHRRGWAWLTLPRLSPKAARIAPPLPAPANDAKPLATNDAGLPLRRANWIAQFGAGLHSAARGATNAETSHETSHEARRKTDHFADFAESGPAKTASRLAEFAHPTTSHRLEDWGTAGNPDTAQVSTFADTSFTDRGRAFAHFAAADPEHQAMPDVWPAQRHAGSQSAVECQPVLPFEPRAGNVWPAIPAGSARHADFHMIGADHTSRPVGAATSRHPSPWPALPASELIATDAQVSPLDESLLRREQMVGLWSA